MGLVKAGAAAVVVVSASEVPGPTVNVNSGRGERTETRAQAVPWLEIGLSDGNEIMRGLRTEGQFYCSMEGWLNDLRIRESEYLPELSRIPIFLPFMHRELGPVRALTAVLQEGSHNCPLETKGAHTCLQGIANMGLNRLGP